MSDAKEFDSELKQNIDQRIKHINEELTDPNERSPIHEKENYDVDK